MIEGNEILVRYGEQPKVARIDEQLEAELEEQIRIDKLMRKGVLR